VSSSHSRSFSKKGSRLVLRPYSTDDYSIPSKANLFPSICFKLACEILLPQTPDPLRTKTWPHSTYPAQTDSTPKTHPPHHLISSQQQETSIYPTKSSKYSTLMPSLFFLIVLNFDSDTVNWSISHRHGHYVSEPSYRHEAEGERCDPKASTLWHLVWCVNSICPALPLLWLFIRSIWLLSDPPIHHLTKL
jgi:hypothetical protein